MRRTGMRQLTVVLVLAIIVAGCAATGESGRPSAPSESLERLPDQSAPPADAGQPPEDRLLDPTDAARRDLADRLGVALEDLEAVSFEQVTWSDGALGCPQPGMAYTQALVPGYRIVLVHDDGEFIYHGADGGDPFLCEGSRPPSEGTPRMPPRP